MIAEPIRALLGEDLAGRVEEVLRGAGPEGGDLDLVAGNDGSYLPAGEVERRRRTAALRAGLDSMQEKADALVRQSREEAQTDAEALKAAADVHMKEAVRVIVWEMFDSCQ